LEVVLEIGYSSVEVFDEEVEGKGFEFEFVFELREE
jgi:hypothetical protein